MRKIIFFLDEIEVEGGGEGGDADEAADEGGGGLGGGGGEAETIRSHHHSFTVYTGKKFLVMCKQMKQF